MITVLNFSHPTTPAQIGAISDLHNGALIDVRTIPVQLDLTAPLEPQVKHILDGLSFRDDDEIIVNPPGLAVAAVLIIRALDRRFGHQVRILRLATEPGVVPPRYYVAEII